MARKIAKNEKMRRRLVAKGNGVCYNIDMMKRIWTDVHTHTTFSSDGRNTIEEMLAAAHAKGIAYYGISEHFDLDILVNKIPVYDTYRHTSAEEYFRKGRELQAEYAGKMNVLIGGEFGYTDTPEAHELYQQLYDRYSPDFVVNSLHNLPCGDYCRKKPFLNADGSLRDKDEVYEEYFALVLRSTQVSYPYDILGHLTYCTRYAPYEDRTAKWKDYSQSIDRILLEVIARGKILEVNSSNRGGVSLMLPDVDILERYYELGGRKLSFASDAHFISRIAEHRDEVCDLLKAIGFDYVTVPVRGKHVEVEI